MTLTHTVLLDDTERQQVFRACLDALTRPGTPHPLHVERHPALRLPMLALTDLMTPIAALGTDPATHRAVEEIAGLTRAPTGAVATARWVLAGPDLNADQLADLPQGSDEEPQLGAMLVLPLDGAQTGHRLSGPGVDGHLDLALGLAPDLIRARAGLLTGYPRGFDLLCITPTAHVVGIPRTTVITEEPQ